MSDECAKGCNGSDALGHTGWCWQQKYNALTEQLTAESAARLAAEQELAETIEDRALSFRQADAAHERYLGTRREREDLQRQLSAKDQQIAALHVSVRTLGAALGACMADPHTDKCRSLWLCEQHRALLETPAGEDGAGEAMMLPDPAKLWALAEWLDAKYPNDPKPEVQDDLRTWARAIYATDPVKYAKFRQKEVIEATGQQQPGEDE